MAAAEGEKTNDLEAWLVENKLPTSYVAMLNENEVSSLDDLRELTSQEEVDELVGELGLKLIARKKLTRCILALINAKAATAAQTNDNNVQPGAAKVAQNMSSQQPSANVANSKGTDDEKKDGSLEEREIFENGINVVPFEKQMYCVPPLKDDDYAFRGGSGFAANAVTVWKTISKKVNNLKNGLFGGQESKDDEKDSEAAQTTPERLFSSKNHKIILICGKTGAGKSTLINSMMNYVYNVQYDDKFRLKLIDEKLKAQGNAASTTDHISSYRIKQPKGGNIKYDLTIVDTPGFGDVRGLKKDMQILEEFKYVFNSVLTSVDAICFVVKSADNRLDASQTYVFNNILNLWAKDVMDNIFILMTFADGKKANCVDALNANETLKLCKKRFKINNSAFTDDPMDKNFDNMDQFDKLFWDMGNQCFQKFFDELEKVTPQPIEQSKQVLKKRDCILTQIHHISMNLNTTLSMQQEMNNRQKFIKQNEAAINAGKEVVYYQSYIEYEKFNVENCYVTTCHRHHKSCHPGCCVSDKNDCAVMNNDGYCEVCSCPASEHTNQSYEYRPVTKQKRISNWDGNDNLKGMYTQGVQDKERASRELKRLENQLQDLEKAAEHKVAMVHSLRNELETIALRPTLSTVGEYIDTLIQNEEDSPQKDNDKIQMLKDLKKKEKIIAKLQESDQISLKDYE